jgi:hypothetical protein
MSGGCARVRRGESGQAGVEFVALVLLACLALGALAAGAGKAFHGRSYGGFLARHFVCAVSARGAPSGGSDDAALARSDGGGCDRDERALVTAYGERAAARVRELAPGLVFEGGERQLPVDWRECRRPECAGAPDDGALDAHITAAGLRATAFTRLIRRGGQLYVEYWLYYPDSNSTLGASDRIWSLTGLPYPGFHRDDWEGAVVRLDRGGRIWIRASSHGGFQGCKWRECDGRWVRSTGWVRVSRGSHSGHVPYRSELVWDPPPPPLSPRSLARPPRRRRIPLLPGRDLEERTTSAEGLRLVPLETRGRHGYVPLDPAVRPPWRKRAYRDPEADES